MNLSNILGLRPLDRLQINNQQEISNMRHDQRIHGRGELRFCFFQRILPDGNLEVRSPGGRVDLVSPHDVSDIIRGEPITVRAMTTMAFIDRLKCSGRERQQRPSPSCYADAHILYASKNNKACPEFHVWFIDPTLNTTGSPWLAPLMDEDRRRVLSKARRNIMPVSEWHGSSNYSADGGCDKEAEYNRDIAKHFFAASLAGRKDALSMLSMAGIKRPSRAALDRLAA